jgi:hypothetical protein
MLKLTFSFLVASASATLLYLPAAFASSYAIEARTSDNAWAYGITSRDAARFGGNKPSDYIVNNVCTPQNSSTTVDNGEGGTLSTRFTGDWSYCNGIVTVAEDWQSNSNGSWWLYSDIVIFDSQGNPAASLSF